MSSLSTIFALLLNGKTTMAGPIPCSRYEVFHDWSGYNYHLEFVHEQAEPGLFPVSHALIYIDSEPYYVGAENLMFVVEGRRIELRHNLTIPVSETVE